MTFFELERLFLDNIRGRVRAGEITERRLARMSGISQPHIHNVLAGKRSLSIDSADTILQVLEFDLMDLLDPEESRPSGADWQSGTGRGPILRYPEYLREDARTSDPRLRRLASAIESLAEKDERVERQTREIDGLRRRAAAELFTVCAGFVDALNQLLPEPVVLLDPHAFPMDRFNEDGANLIQINVRGRILQVEFQATPELLSTEEFRVPYTLSGSIRAFNQALLEKDLVEEQLIFYTVDRQQTMWRYFDARTYRSGAFDRDYLISLMDQLL